MLVSPVIGLTLSIIYIHLSDFPNSDWLGGLLWLAIFTPLVIDTILVPIYMLTGSCVVHRLIVSLVFTVLIYPTPLLIIMHLLFEW